MSAKTSITGIVVVRNEEDPLRICLESLDKVCKNMIVIHDGPCQNRAVKIAMEFTDAVLERADYGAPEPHLIDALYMSSDSWILYLHANEYLSDELIMHIQQISFRNTPYSHFKVRWREWNLDEIFKEEFCTEKILLFNKNYTVNSGIPRHAVVCPGRGKVLDGFLEKSCSLNRSFLDLITRQMIDFAKVDSKLRFLCMSKVYPDNAVYRIPQRHVVRNKYPFLTLPIFCMTAYGRALWQLRNATGLRKLRTGFIFTQLQLVYEIYLSFFISQVKRRVNDSYDVETNVSIDQDPHELYDEQYFERGLLSGKSCYMNYRWMPELTIRMFYYMMKDLPIQDGDRILDYGCAKGYLVRAARIIDFEAYGVDVSDYAIRNVDPMVSAYCKLLRKGQSIRELFNISFDWVISKDVFEHIPEAELPEVLQDIAQIARFLFVVVPVSEDDQSGKFIIPEYNKDPTHVTVKSARWWADLLEKNHFSLEKASFQFRYCKENWTSVWPKGNAFFVSKSDLFKK